MALESREGRMTLMKQCVTYIQATQYHGRLYSHGSAWNHFVLMTALKSHVIPVLKRSC